MVSTWNIASTTTPRINTCLATIVLLLAWNGGGNRFSLPSSSSMSSSATYSAVSALVIQDPTPTSGNGRDRIRRHGPRGTPESSTRMQFSHLHPRYNEDEDTTNTNQNTNTNRVGSERITTTTTTTTTTTSFAPKRLAATLLLAAAASVGMAVAPHMASAAENGGSATPSSSIADSAAFRLLPRRRETAAMSRLLDLRELQDERLAQCIDRGEYWEQCFYNGMRDDTKGIDYQWGSPEAALEIPLERGTRQQPAATTTTSSSSRPIKPPTW